MPPVLPIASLDDHMKRNADFEELEILRFEDPGGAKFYNFYRIYKLAKNSAPRAEAPGPLPARRQKAMPTRMDRTLWLKVEPAALSTSTKPRSYRTSPTSAMNPRLYRREAPKTNPKSVFF